MANDWEDNFGSDDSSDGPRALREAYDKLKSENGELKKELSSLSKTVRTSTVATVLKEKGLDPKVADLIPSDVEPTVDAVGKWLEQYGALFTPTAQGGAEGGQSDQSADGSLIPEADQRELARIEGTVQGGEVASDTATAISQRIANAQSSDEVLAIMAEAGFTR